MSPGPLSPAWDNGYKEEVGWSGRGHRHRHRTFEQLSSWEGPTVSIPVGSRQVGDQASKHPEPGADREGSYGAA